MARDFWGLMDSLGEGALPQGPQQAPRQLIGSNDARSFGGSHMPIPFLGGQARPDYAGGSQLQTGSVEADGRPEWIKKMDAFLGSEAMQGFGDSLDARYQQGVQRAAMMNSIPRNIQAPKNFRSQGQDGLAALLNSYLGRG